MQDLASRLAEGSFNRIPVDGDTSTNDSLLVIASNRAGNAPIESLDGAGRTTAFRCSCLAWLGSLRTGPSCGNGEGATKFITVVVEGGGAPRGVPPGSLCHCAFSVGENRFLRQRPQPWSALRWAMPYRPTPRPIGSESRLYLDDVHVVTRGGRTQATKKQMASCVHAAIRDHGARAFGTGGCRWDTVWTCDFSHDYVTINAGSARSLTRGVWPKLFAMTDQSDPVFRPVPKLFMARVEAALARGLVEPDWVRRWPFDTADVRPDKVRPRRCSTSVRWHLRSSRKSTRKRKESVATPSSLFVVLRPTTYCSRGARGTGKSFLDSGLSACVRPTGGSTSDRGG